MASKKVRRIDFYHDEYIAGVGGTMSAENQGVYWMVCSLIFSHGGEVENDPKRIGRLVCLGAAKTKRIIDELVSERKLSVNGTKLSQKRAENELEKAQKRIENASENGKKGGRPGKKNNNLGKAPGLNGEKLTTNHQPPTTNQDTTVSYVMETFDLFWEQFPRQRRGNKAKAKSAYLRALKEHRATDVDIAGGLMRYVNSSEVADGYAKGAEAWLNDDRWKSDYATQPQQQGGGQGAEIRAAFQAMADKEMGK